MRRRYLSDFNSPTPRAVPLSVRLRVLFGGFNNQFGWIFFGFGLIFVWGFAIHADVASLFLFRFQTKSTQGIVETVQAKNASENDGQIYQVSYTYFDNFRDQVRVESQSVALPGEDRFW
jgi:uncharacterized Rmd1/YagE family protein